MRNQVHDHALRGQAVESHQACGTCLNAVLTEGAACFDSVSAACESDDDCMASEACLKKCPAD